MKALRISRLATTGFCIAMIATAPRLLAGQATSRDSLAVNIERGIRGVTVISPITEGVVSGDAVRLVQETVWRSTAEVRIRMMKALTPSGANRDVIDQLLESLARIGAQPTPAHAHKAEQAFNDFVRAASPSFLVEPPAEFLALHAILLRIANAADGIKT